MKEAKFKIDDLVYITNEHYSNGDLSRLVSSGKARIGDVVVVKFVEWNGTIGEWGV